MGDYATTTQVRTLGGFSTTQIDDTALGLVIDLAEDRVDSEVEVSLSSTQKTLATIYLTCAMVQERFASVTSSNDGVDYVLDRLRVNKGSAITLRNAVALRFYEQYRAILRAATSGDNIIERVEG